MKLLLICLAGILIFFSPLAGSAQPQQSIPATTAKKDTAAKADTAANNGVANINSAVHQPDDEFNLFLFAYLIAFCMVIAGAVVVGSVATVLLLLALFALVSVGIVSAGALVGIYRRSVSAGFRTFLVIIGSLGGIVAGAGCLWLIDRFFHIHLGGRNAVLLGAAGGLIGGALLGLIVFWIIRSFIGYCRQKFSFPTT